MTTKATVSSLVTRALRPVFLLPASSSPDCMQAGQSEDVIALSPGHKLSTFVEAGVGTKWRQEL